MNDKMVTNNDIDHNNKLSETKGRLGTNKAILFILIIATIVRLFYFTGFVNAWVQDESIYYYNITDLAQGRSPFVQNSQHISRIDPSSTFSTRIAFLYLQALVLNLAKGNSIVLFLLPLLFSLADIFIIYKLGCLLRAKRVGLIASIILAFTPIHIHYAGRIMPEQMLSFVFDICIFSCISYIITKKKYWIFIAGILLGVGIYVKEIMPLLCFLVAIWLLIKKEYKATVLFISGIFCIVFFASSFFLIKTGNINYYSDVLKTTRLTKYSNEGTEETIIGNQLILVHPRNYNYIYHIRNLFTPLGFRFGRFGYPYLFLFPLFIISFFFCRKAKYLVFMAIIVCAYIIYLEFGFVNLQFHSGHIYLHQIMKEYSDSVRYPHFLCGIVAICIAIALDSINLRKSIKYIITSFVLIFIIFSSLLASKDIMNELSEPISDLRQMMNVINPLIKDKTIKLYFMDHLAKSYFSYATDRKMDDRASMINDLNYGKSNDDEISLLVYGGSRSRDISGSIVTENKAYLDYLPLIPIFKLSKPLSSTRKCNLTIYRILKLREFNDSKTNSLMSQEIDKSTEILHWNDYNKLDLEKEREIIQVISDRLKLAHYNIVFAFDCLFVDGQLLIELFGDQVNLKKITYKPPKGYGFKLFNRIDKLDSSRFELVKIMGRGKSHITQFPKKENQFKLIIDIDDSLYGGADHYTIAVIKYY